ncbi:MAG: ATP-binding protein [Leptospiraceae bacterium]|nr:ATP-binding protein [Leptospiraceae bacterium]MCP5498054.1 ATP-binding protein [Leptospiraceae bacterium]
MLEWKDSPYRKPLIIRGARQVGKSYLIREFAKNEFESFVEINLELQPELKACFNTKMPDKILKSIQLILNKEIKAGQTIFFLDEIQECPEAILSLRYFYELMPELHVIAAGSLLEFALNREEFRSPVGRIEYLHLYPLSFEEFLNALDEGLILKFLHEVKLSDEFASPVHEKLLELYKDYLLVGGMPEVVKTYRETKNFTTIKKIQISLLQTYRDDFSKYGSSAKQKNLEKVFYHVPVILGKKIKYVEIDKDTPSRELKNAIDLLESAGVVNRVVASSKAQLPLSYYAKDNFFKLIFLDTGLALRTTGLEETVFTSPNLLGVYEGGLAEQFVGQELIANSDPLEKAKLYNWERMKPSSTAEVDYLFVYKSNIYPVEVKAGKTGSLKSLQVYNKENMNQISIRYSKLPLSFHEGLLSVPLYMIAETSKLIDEALLNNI